MKLTDMDDHHNYLVATYRGHRFALFYDDRRPEDAIEAIGSWHSAKLFSDEEYIKLATLVVENKA